MTALRHAIDARGGIGRIADQTGLNRETLYRTISANGNPTLKTLTAVMTAVGVPLSSFHLTEAPAPAPVIQIAESGKEPR